MHITGITVQYMYCISLNKSWGIAIKLNYKYANLAFKKLISLVDTALSS